MPPSLWCWSFRARSVADLLMDWQQSSPFCSMSFFCFFSSCAQALLQRARRALEPLGDFLGNPGSHAQALYFFPLDFRATIAREHQRFGFFLRVVVAPGGGDDTLFSSLSCCCPLSQLREAPGGRTSFWLPTLLVRSELIFELASGLMSFFP